MPASRSRRAPRGVAASRRRAGSGPRARAYGPRRQNGTTPVLSLCAAAAASVRRPMIAQVEPLDDPPARRPVRLRAAGRAGGGRVGRAGAVRAPGARRRRRRAGRASEVPADGSSRRPRRSRTRFRPTRRLALWMAASTARRPHARCRSCCRRAGRPRAQLWAARAGAPLDGERLTGTPARAARRPAAGRRAAILPPCGGWRRAGWCAIAPRAPARAADAPAPDRVVSRDGRAGGRAGRRRRRRRLAAARRHRLGQDRGLSARRGRGARTRRGRDRARAGDRAHAADRRPLPGPLRRHRRAAALRAGRR